MRLKKHLAIVVSNQVNKNDFINKILANKLQGEFNFFANSKGVLFSDIAIANYIEEEHKHRTIEITKLENRQLRTFSSGERRKAFFNYCLAQNPDYIIVDNPFEHLDHQSRVELSNNLEKLSNTISIIQLSDREESFLQFITNRWSVNDNFGVLTELPSTTTITPQILQSDIPSSLLSFNEKYNSIVTFKDVSVSYNDNAIVKDITWTVKKGEFWQLIGPNGSGKSTLLSLITGDNPKAYGQNITIFDKKKGSGESIWDIKKKIGHFSTNLTELFKRNHTVEQMILSGFFDSIGLYQEPSDLQQEKVEQWLNIIKMSRLKKHYFNKLTLGQQRLVLIIRALIKQPPLLILDEPVEGLDFENTNLVIHLINTLVEKTDITLIYVSHAIEKSIIPKNIYQLRPSKKGSTGHLKSKH